MSSGPSLPLVAVPIFAFFSAGVEIDGWAGLTETLREPVAVGVVLGLVVGKTLGVFGTTWLASTFTHARLDDDLSWWDVLGLSILGGVGFTVSLLIGELASELGPTPTTTPRSRSSPLRRPPRWPAYQAAGSQQGP